MMQYQLAKKWVILNIYIYDALYIDGHRIVEL